MELLAYASAPTSEDLASRVARMSVSDSARTPPTPVPDGAAAGTSAVMSMFRQGGAIVLQSVTSGRSLCIYEGQVSGKGIRDSYSQFIVHIRPPGRVALQNVANPANWIGIYEGRTLGSGNGGPYSEFNLQEVEDKYVALESAFYRGQYVGISEDGELKPPAETPPLDRPSLFIPFPHSTVTTTSEAYQMAAPATPEKSDLPPPYPGPSPTTSQGAGYPAEMGAGAMIGAAVPPSTNPNPIYPPPPNLPSYVPPEHIPYLPQQQGPYLPQQQGPYLPQQPGPYLPQQQGPYLPQQQGPYLQPGASPVIPHSAACQSVPTGPTTPLGYEIMDLFNEYNTILIIPRVDLCARPLGVVKGVFGPSTFRAGGTFLGADCAFYAVFSSDGGLVLRHCATSAAICVNDMKKIFLSKNPVSYGVDYEFIVRKIEGVNVSFESIKFPEHYLFVGKDGIAKVETAATHSYEVQFTIRVNAFKGPYSKVITSPFAPGRPSVVNQLKDRSVIQLYYKPSMSYLCLVEGGRVLPTPNEEQGTFLVYRDRGMGRVSLTGYYRGIQKLRMEMNGRLSSVGADDVNTDFYVKESSNGTLLFESVAFPGKFVQLQFKGVEFKEFSVYLMDMNRLEVRGRKKTIPKYALN